VCNDKLYYGKIFSNQNICVDKSKTIKMLIQIIRMYIIERQHQ